MSSSLRATCRLSCDLKKVSPTSLGSGGLAASAFRNQISPSVRLEFGIKTVRAGAVRFGSELLGSVLARSDRHPMRTSTPLYTPTPSHPHTPPHSWSGANAAFLAFGDLFIGAWARDVLPRSRRPGTHRTKFAPGNPLFSRCCSYRGLWLLKCAKTLGANAVVEMVCVRSRMFCPFIASVVRIGGFGFQSAQKH